MTLPPRKVFDVALRNGVRLRYMLQLLSNMRWWLAVMVGFWVTPVIAVITGEVTVVGLRHLFPLSLLVTWPFALRRSWRLTLIGACMAWVLVAIYLLIVGEGLQEGAGHRISSDLFYTLAAIFLVSWLPIVILRLVQSIVPETWWPIGFVLGIVPWIWIVIGRLPESRLLSASAMMIVVGLGAWIPFLLLILTFVRPVRSVLWRLRVKHRQAK